MVTIRTANLADLKAITEIYNEAVLNTDASFDIKPKTVTEQEAWFAHHGTRRPVLVAELDGGVVGWASLSEWSHHNAYADTVEVSLYVKLMFWRRGIGGKLLEEILLAGEKVGLHTVIARITAGNSVSIHLHESAGFEHIGVMREVGRKFGRLLDVHMMQKIYPSPQSPVK
ncbi:MAG: N-acetyltransferase family protein [Dehalococcoidales bacterium]|nr:N-acetyltransferase family protein [Dehalococcoidales bacterium]